MGTIQTVKTEKQKKNKSKFQFERDKVRQQTDINYNGILLGRNDFINGRTYYLDNETNEVIELGIFNNPFQAGEALLKFHESRKELREVRQQEKYTQWINSPLVKIMLDDYNNLPDDFFKPKEFKTFYRRHIFEYEVKYPELINE